MPGYRGHLLGGVIFWGAAFFLVIWASLYQPSLEDAFVLLCITLMASLFPDVDTDSKGQNLFYSCFVILDISLMVQKQYKWAAILGFFGLLPALGHHRGWTHTWWAMLVVPMPIIILPILFYEQSLEKLVPYYLAAVLGYFSHLALDRKF